MAKRRKKAHRRRMRGRSVGALLGLGGSDATIKLASLAGGFFLAGSINPQIDKLVNKIMPTTTGTTPSTSNATVAAVGQLGIGGLLLVRKFGSGTTGKALTVAGGLLAGAGLQRALKTMGIITGYQSVPVIGRHRMAGYQNVPVVGQRVTPPQLAGRPAQLQGYRVNGKMGAYTPAGSGVMGSIGSAGYEAGSGINNTGGGGYMG